MPEGSGDLVSGELKPQFDEFMTPLIAYGLGPGGMEPTALFGNGKEDRTYHSFWDHIQ